MKLYSYPEIYMNMQPGDVHQLAGKGRDVTPEHGETRPETVTPSASEAWSVHDDVRNMNCVARGSPRVEPAATNEGGAA